MMYHVTYVCVYLFKILLEEDLRTTTDVEAEASDFSEPPEKASRAELEAAVASCSSSFMKEFDRIREEREEPGGVHPALA